MALCDIKVMLVKKQAEGCDSGASRAFVPSTPTGRVAQVRAGSHRPGADSRTLCARHPTWGWTRQEAAPCSLGGLALAHFSNKSKSLEYWSLGAENGAAIIHSFCAFLSCKHFPFSRADKFAFPRN